MACSRTSATRALRHVTGAKRQTRRLRLTAPANLPVRTAATDKKVLAGPLQTTANKAKPDECGRPFSTSDSSYDSPSALHHTTASADYLTITLAAPSTAPFSPTNHTRQFNTSRQLKRTGDSSTIDFAYLPDVPGPTVVEEEIVVPLVPWNIEPVRREAAPAVSPEPMLDMPSITTAAADSTHLSSPSAMADVHDGGGHLLDFHEVAETLTAAVKKVTLGTERESDEETKRAKSLVKQVWTGMLDDLFGQKTQKS